jgi:hypothetical protein
MVIAGRVMVSVVVLAGSVETEVCVRAEREVVAV